MFNRVRGIDVDRKGNIYILDSQSVQVRVFDKNRLFLRAFGHRGQELGEMERPIFIQITPDQKVVISDPPTRRLVFFSLEGNYLRQVSTTRINSPLLPIGFKPNGNLIAMTIPPPPKGGMELKESPVELYLFI